MARSFSSASSSFQGNRGWEIEDSDGYALGDFLLRGVRQQILVAQAPPDHAEQVERAVARDQVQVPG